MHILITGAAGFVGRHVATEYAKYGAHVTGIDRVEWADWQRHGVSEFHCGEVTLDHLVEHAGRPEVIVHCAGGASVGFSIQEPYQDFIQTVITTAQVLEFMRLHAPNTKLVYPSSAAVYGQVRQLPISEDAPLQPISPYGAHKQMAETLCQLYARQYHLSLSIVRLFSIYGAGLRKQLLWDACSKLVRGELEFFGTGEEIRDWLHVDDAAKLLVLAAEHSSPSCTILNGGSGEGVSVNSILQQICAQLGSGVLPSFAATRKEGDPTSFIANINIAKQWGWQPSIDWRQGVSSYVEWYKKCQ